LIWNPGKGKAMPLKGKHIFVCKVFSCITILQVLAPSPEKVLQAHLFDTRISLNGGVEHGLGPVENQIFVIFCENFKLTFM